MGQMAQDPDQMLAGIQRERERQRQAYRQAADSTLGVISNQVAGARKQSFWGDLLREGPTAAAGLAANLSLPGVGSAITGMALTKAFTGNDYDSVANPELRKIAQSGPLFGRFAFPGFDDVEHGQRLAIAELKARDPNFNLDPKTTEGKQNMLLARGLGEELTNLWRSGESFIDRDRNNQLIAKRLGVRQTNLQQKADEAKADVERITLARADQAFQRARDREQLNANLFSSLVNAYVSAGR